MQIPERKFVYKKVQIDGKKLFLLKKTIEIMNGARKIRVPEIINATKNNDEFKLFALIFTSRIVNTPNEIR